MLRKLLTSITLMALTACAMPMPSSSPSTKTVAAVRELDPIQLPADFQYPNGIARATDGTLYVGSVTSGRILRIDPTGNVVTFFPGNEAVFAATALRLDESRGILWGSSPDFLGTRGANGEIVRRSPRVFAIDTRSGEVVRVLAIPDGGLGNDIAIDSEGGVYITDSVNPRIYHLPPGETQLQIWAEDEQLRDERERIGASGIARREDGMIVVGQFSSGQLFRIVPQVDQPARVEEIPLERKIENPDGMQFAPDGSLILTEGAIESGDGRLLRIHISAPSTEPKAIETIAAGISSPVNLTVTGREVWVTESQIRHRLLPGRENEVPSQFFVQRFRL